MESSKGHGGTAPRHLTSPVEGNDPSFSHPGCFASGSMGLSRSGHSTTCF